MKLTKKDFTDYGNCAESQPFIDYLFGGEDELDGDELWRRAIEAVGKAPFNITKEKMQKYLYDPQHYICDHDLIRQYLNIVNSEMVRYSKNIKDCRYVYYSENLENCYYCYDSKNSKNMLMSCKDDSDEYMIANKPVTQEEFDGVLERIEDAQSRLGKDFDIFETLRGLGIEVYPKDVLNEDAREFFLGIRRKRP